MYVKERDRERERDEVGRRGRRGREKREILAMATRASTLGMSRFAASSCPSLFPKCDCVDPFYSRAGTKQLSTGRGKGSLVPNTPRSLNCLLPIAVFFLQVLKVGLYPYAISTVSR